LSDRQIVLGGRYLLVEKIGEGGMATVFLGTDQVLGRTVAVKVLAPNYARDQNFVQRFRREAQAAARMNHPGVVSVYDTGSDDGTHYIVMEHVQGRTLAEILKSEGHLLPDRAAEIAEAVAAALSFAHAQGIVHRDIKPANIMITPQGEVKVMDFGIARATASGDTLTQTATVLGTATYLSPEQAQGEPVDARSDIYSLGVVLYELLTGQPPFTGDSPVAVAYKHVREDPPSPSRLNQGVPQGLEAVTMKALAKNPSNRYQSADEMRADLDRVRRGQPPLATPLLVPDQTQVIGRQARPTTVLPSVPPGEEGRGRRIAAWVVLGLIVLGGLVALFLFLYKSIVGSQPQVAVPRVIGLSRQAAVSLIENRGLKVGDVTKAASARVAKGDVIAQDPKPHDQVDKGSSVSLVISSGPPQVGVPDVRGKSVSDATAILEQAGFVVGNTVEQSSPKPQGTVIGQSPSPHSKADKGSAVDLVVSSGPQLVAVPDVVCQTLDEARAELNSKGLDMVEAGSDANLNCPDPTRVARQDPDAGSEVPRGSAVKVYSAEPPPSASPSPSPIP
jgi:eukaryotic-like serine/threonine-protein kinase